jgi:hypothetical protein
MGMTFNVYSMAWYVEADAAQADPTLKAYKSRSLSELQSTEDFYQQLSSAGGYDRTLFVKLAMTLKTKMLIEGLLAEIVMQPQNKAAVARASAAYTAPVCPEGLEVIFTWRVPKRGAPATDRGYLEVRIGDVYFELHEPGLAEEFMKQFFAREKPVSPSAKRGFVTFFPALLRGQKHTVSGGSDMGKAPSSSMPSTANAPLSAGASAAKSPRQVAAGMFGLRVSQLYER